MASPFQIILYDKAFTEVGRMGDPKVLNVKPAFNATGTATITLPSSHRKLPLLVAEGARAVIYYRDEFMMSGPLRMMTGSGTTMTGDFTFVLEDDFRLFARMLGWPRPDQPITSQGLAGDKRTGPAETVAKQFAQLNAARMGLPLTVETTGGRGATITVESKMQVLADVLFPAVTDAGVGLRVRQQGAGLRLEAYTPRTYPVDLTEEAGVITGYTWSRTPAKVTRTVVQTSGVGSSKAYVLYPAGVTSGRTADETLWGDVVESLTDATSTDVTAEINQAGQQTLTENGTTYGLSLSLSETDTFRYGQNLRVGDKVTARLAAGVVVTDTLASAELNWDADNGLVVTPQVGERTDDPNVNLMKSLSKLGRAVRGILARS